MVSDKMIGKILLFFCLFSLPFLPIHAQTNPTPGQIRPALQILDSTKEQDGLVGSVRRVRTEYAKITLKEGQPIEGPRQLLEVTTYGVRGNRVENVSYPINDSAVGREEYKYDDHGNIVEKVLRDESGAILSRETYEYVFDDVGNWTKMLTSLVVIENGEEKHEPTEVTYRTLTYYARDTAPRSVATAATDSADVKPLKVANTENTEKSPESAVSGAVTADPPKVDEGQTSAPTTNSVPTEKKDEPANAEASGSLPQSTVDIHTVALTPIATETAVTLNGSSEKPSGIEQESSETSTPAYAPGIVKTAKKAKTEVKAPIAEAEIQSEPPKNGESEKVANGNTGPTLTDTGSVTPVNGNTSSTAEVTNPSKLAANPTSSRAENTTPPASENTESASAASSATLTKALEFYRLGRQHFEAGDVSSAIEAYLESSRLEPNSAEIQLNLGHAYLTAKKDKDAARAFKEAVRLNPDLAEAYYGLGFVSFRLTRFKDAMDAFKKATVITPEMAKAHYGLALAYQELGKVDELIQEYRLLQKLDPKLAAKLTQMFSDIDFSCRGSRFCK